MVKNTENPVESVSDLHRRDAKRMGLNHSLMKTTMIVQADVGKIFVVSADEVTGRIMSHAEFLQIPVDQIHSWVQIGEFDVNRW